MWGQMEESKLGVQGRDVRGEKELAFIDCIVLDVM